MTSGDAETYAGKDRADLWDTAADERQRLADEREQLATERENLANERERLADEHERLLDERYETLVSDGRPAPAQDAEFTRVEAEATLARAEARLHRAVAERERAQLALERADLGGERHGADAERSADPVAGAGDDEERWHLDRRAFVAADRERIASWRDEAQDTRDDLAGRRERDADQRDRYARKREEDLAGREAQRLKRSATTIAHHQVLRARGDVSYVREASDRQRRAAALIRHGAAVDRADARGRVGSFTPDPYGPRLLAEFIDLTRELFASQQFSEVADRTLGFALECLPGCVAAGVTLVTGGQPRLRIATNEVAEQLDTFQIQNGQGPACEALDSPEPVHAATLAPWPDLVFVANELGIEGALAYALSVPRRDMWQPLGMLTFYVEESAAIDAEVTDLGSVLAAYLSVAAGLDQDRTDLRRREAALHRALSTRDVIGQAKGILMERRRIPAGQAFDILRRASQRLNLRLHEVAARLTETGEVPNKRSSRRNCSP